jgi:hypothetical protein
MRRTLATTRTIRRAEMKRRSFLLPLAVSLAALAGGAGAAAAKPVSSSSIMPPVELVAVATPLPAKPLVLKRVNSSVTEKFARHYSHRSHSSHSSHYSHRSHYSSR